MKKSVLFIIIFTLIAKILGFIRDILLANFYGASSVSDAFIISQTLPVYLFAFFVAAINAGFIPQYTSLKAKNVNRPDIYVNILINFLLLVSTIIILFTFIFTENIVNLFASNFTSETFKLAVSLTKISIWSIYGLSLFTIFSSLLNANNKFILPALSSVLMNVVLIATIYFAYIFENPLVLAYGHLVSTFIQIPLLLFGLKKIKFKPKFVKKIFNDDIKELIIFSIPVMLGVAITDLNVIVDKNIASNIVGGISAINYATKITTLISSIFILSITTVSFTKLSQLVVEKNNNLIIKLIEKNLKYLLLILIPGTLGLIFFNQSIVDIVFFRGNFTNSDAKMTSQLLLFYSIGLIAIGTRQLILRIFYSYKDKKAIFMNGAIAAFINISLNILFFYVLKWGLAGLAIATTISVYITTFFLFYRLRKKYNLGLSIVIFYDFIKLFIIAILMIIVAKITYNGLIFYINARISFLISSVIGMILYFTIIYFINYNGVRNSINLLIKKYIKC